MNKHSVSSFDSSPWTEFNFVCTSETQIASRMSVDCDDNSTASGLSDCSTLDQDSNNNNASMSDSSLSNSNQQQQEELIVSHPTKIQVACLGVSTRNIFNKRKQN